MKKFKTVFIGTPDFAVPSLEKLIQDDRFEILGVITQEDKKVGRKQIITPPPVKAKVLEYDIPVWQPNKLKNIKENLKKLDLDFIVVVAYGKIVPQSILDIPKYGCVNIHGSLLPKYRGAAVIQAPILNGDNESGVTIMKMDAGLDTGPIIKILETPLDPKETVESLHNRLMNLGSENLAKVLVDYSKGKLKLIEQDDNQSTYIKMLTKEDGRINWNKTALEIERMVRGLNPWPGTFTKDSNGKTLKILEVDNNILDINKYKIGEVFLHENKLAVQCGKESLIISKLQMEGKKAMMIEDFLRGQTSFIETILK